MGRIPEAGAVTLYALILEVAALAVALPLFVGPAGVGRHLGFAGLLCVLASLSVFSVAFLALRHGPIDTPARGWRLGLWAAGGFYALILLIFGLVPSLATLADGDLATATAYLGDVVRVAALGSYGLPVLIGVAGGAAYGWYRGKRARRRAGSGPV